MYLFTHLLIMSLPCIYSPMCWCVCRPQMTVNAAMQHAAGIRPGDRVLVHAAAGGVGLAALQVGRGREWQC